MKAALATLCALLAFSGQAAAEHAIFLPVTPERAQKAPANLQGIQVAEALSSLSRSEIRRVQAALNKAGFNAGPADGLMGRKTRSAIDAWQRRNGYPATGTLSQSQARALLSSAPARSRFRRRV